MLLLPIKSGTWKIYAFCEKDGRCQVLSFLGGLNLKYHGSRSRLFAILSRASTEHLGPNQFPVEMSHLASNKEKIYEFIAGDLRLLWFYSPHEKRVIICSAAYLKKTQKTDKKLIANAIEIQKQYSLAYQDGNISILVEEDN